MEIFKILKEVINSFFTSSIISKLIFFISAFFAPIYELYILLIFLVSIDYLMDLGVWFFAGDKRNTKVWDVTKPFIVKLIMYSLLVITVNSVQLHLIKEAFELFKMVIAIPIIAELLGIVATVERYTGVQIVDKLKGYLGNWISSKEPKN